MLLKKVEKKKEEEFTPAVLRREMKKIIAARGKRGTDDEAQIKKLLELSHRVSNLMICIFDEHIQMHTHTHTLSLSLSLLPSRVLCNEKKKKTNMDSVFLLHFERNLLKSKAYELKVSDDP